MLFDKEGQASELEDILPVSRLESADRGTGRVTLAGDHKQLPPVSNKKKVEEKWQRALLERPHGISSMNTIMLDMQYLQDIAQWPSSEFYDNSLLTASHLQNVEPRVKGFP